MANDDESDIQEAVHELRKTCKRMRAIVRLVRSHLGETYRVENRFYRDLARRFAGPRDAQVQWQMFQKLSDIATRSELLSAIELKSIGRFLSQQRQEMILSDQQLRLELSRIVPDLQAALSRAADWPIPNGGFSVLRTGLRTQYRDARRAMKIAMVQKEDEAFHAWRKAVKYHGYHANLLRRIAPRLMLAHRDLVDELGERLGQDHDLSVLAGTLRDGVESSDLASASETVQRFLELLATQQQDGRRVARRLGDQVFAERPSALVIRWRSYWKSWRQRSV